MFESKNQLVKESFHPSDEHIEGNKNLEKLYDIVLKKFKELGRPIRLQSVKQFAERNSVDFLPVMRSFGMLDSIPDGLSTGTYRGEQCVAPNSFWKEFNAGNGRRANDAVNRAGRAINDIQADKRLSIEDWLKKHIQKISFELPSGHLRSKYPKATFKAEKELERTFLNRQEKFANDFELFDFKTGLDFTSKDNKEILPNVYVTWRNIDEKTKEANPQYYDEYWNIVGTITFDTEIKNAPDEVILEMEKAKAKSKDEKSRTLNKNTNVISSNAFCQEVFQLFGNSFDFLRNKNNNRIQERFRVVEKKNLTECFMSIHEKSATRFNKNLKKVYEMLDKYGTEKEDVDKVFNRATLKERLEMVKLLKEGTESNIEVYEYEIEDYIWEALDDALNDLDLTWQQWKNLKNKKKILIDVVLQKNKNSYPELANVSKAAVSEVYSDWIDAVDSDWFKNAVEKFYVICTIDGAVVAHGVQEVDTATLTDWEDAEDRAMTDFFDATEIAYSGEYDDDDGEFDWDRLERYVFQADDESTLPKTNREAQKFLDKVLR